MYMVFIILINISYTNYATYFAYNFNKSGNWHFQVFANKLMIAKVTPLYTHENPDLFINNIYISIL